MYRQLAKANPAAYQPNVAPTLNNLAILYGDTQRMKEAESSLPGSPGHSSPTGEGESGRLPAGCCADAEQPGGPLRDTQRMKEAEAAFQEALDICRQLAKANPAAYQPDVARTLNNLATLYSTTQRMKEAEAAYQEALDIYRQLAKANPAAYQPNVAETLNNLGGLYHEPSG